MPLSERDPQNQQQEPHAAAAAAHVASEQTACTACARGVLARQDVKTAIWASERLIVVDGIPALVCQSCGEQYYEDQTAMKLDLMCGSGFLAENAASSMTVPVFDFAASGRSRAAGQSDG